VKNAEGTPFPAAGGGDSVVVRQATIESITPVELYRVLRLRSEVFVVDQQCLYLDLDGRDTEPSTLHMWIERDSEVVCALRVLDNGGGVHRIGRVCTHPAHRSQGLAARLLRHAIDVVGLPVFIGAQTHLERWYAGFGFRVSGEVWDENGIPHLPMTLE
jgi:ElaA protein